MGNACYGIPRLRAAAGNLHSLQPFYADGPFVPDDKVKDLLTERQGLDRALLDPPACSDFKAAQPLGKPSPAQLAAGPHFGI